jgi:phage-related protein (TIGR01555 family)
MYVTEHEYESFRMDNWRSTLTGFGTTWDKQMSLVPYSVAFLTTEEIDALIEGDAFARRIVTALPKAAFRQGWNLVYNGEIDPDKKKADEEKITNKAKELKAKEKILEAIIWGRGYGRGGLLLGVVDGQDVSTELRPDSIREFRYLQVLDRTEFTATAWYDDPREGNYGDPALWQVTKTSGSGQSDVNEIHESRLIVTGGALTSRKKRNENEESDASVLQDILSILQKFNSNRHAVGNMMIDSSQGVLKMTDFVALLVGGHKDVFATRMEIVDRARSSARIMPIDADREEFEYIERSFSGIPDILDKDIHYLCGASGYPATVLFGMAPAGLNATGESDTRSYYDVIRAEQEDKYKPIVETVIQYIAKAEGIDNPELWGIEWPSLWQMSPQEDADHKHKVAEADKIYIDTGVVLPEEVAISRFGGESYSAEAPQIDAESRQQMLEMDRQNPEDDDNDEDDFDDSEEDEE